MGGARDNFNGPTPLKQKSPATISGAGQIYREASNRVEDPLGETQKGLGYRTAFLGAELVRPLLAAILLFHPAVNEKKKNDHCGT